MTAGRSLVAASHPEPAVAVTAVTTALAAAVGRSAGGVVAVLLAVLCGQLSVGWSNDALDAERDRATGRRDKPVARGEVGVRQAWTAAIVALTASVPLSLLSGARAAGAHLVAVALAWAYNFRLKATVLSPAPYAVAFGLLPAFVTLGLPGHPGPAGWAVAAGALLGMGAHVANALPDLADDLATGVRGLPQRLGPTGARLLAASLLAGAGLVLAVGPGGSALLSVTAATATGALAVGGLVAGARRPGSRAAFRAVLLTAVLDVALLLSQAGRLH